MVMRGQESNDKKKKRHLENSAPSSPWCESFSAVHKIRSCEEACVSQETKLKIWHFFAGTEQRGLVEAMGGVGTALALRGAGKEVFSPLASWGAGTTSPSVIRP